MSQRTPRNGSSDRRSWRDSHAPRRPVRGTGAAEHARRPSTRSLRWPFTLLVLLLVSVFVYFLWPRHHGTVHLVALPIWTQDPLAVERVPYVYEDVQRLEQIPGVTFHGYLGLQHADSLATLESSLRALNMSPQDSLILYLGAQVVTDGDQAHVVCSNFLRQADRTQGLFPVRRVLEQVAVCPAKLKLVVLNAGRLDYDLRLGVAANDFARLVEKDLQGAPWPELWVLVPSAPLERPAVVHAQQQSVFAAAFCEALQGAADRWPRDQFVTLHELFAHVYDRCSRWYEADTGASQTPLLMKAGVGVVPCSSDPHGADQYQLVFVGRRPATPETPAPADTPGDTPSVPSAGPPAAGGAADVSGGAPSAPVGSKDKPAPKTPADVAKVDNSLRGLVLQCWRLRDQLEDLARQGAPSPVAWAPHLWRELNARLLYHEHRCWTGRSPLAPADRGTPTPGEKPAENADRPPPETGVQDLPQLRDDLQRLLEAIGAGQPLPRGQYAPDIGSRLVQGWNRYCEQQAAAATAADREGDDLEATAQAERTARKYHALVFATADYVRWHAKASVTSSRPVALYDMLAQWLDQLAATGTALETLTGEQPATNTTADPLALAVKQREQLDNKLQSLLASALKNQNRAIGQQEIEDLLGTALLRAPDRNRLLHALLARSGPTLSPEPPAGLPTLPSGYFVSTDQWQRLRDRLTLEKKLLRLAGVVVAGPETWDSAAAAGTASPAETAGTPRWPRIEVSAREYRGAYERLAQLVRDPLPLKAYRALLLLDPRDVAQVPSDYRLPTFRVRGKQDARLRLAGPPQPVPLAVGQPVAVTVTVSATQRPLLDRPVRPAFDERFLEVAPEPEAAPLPKRDEWYQRQLTWRVRAKLDQTAAGVSETALTVSVADPAGLTDKPEPATVQLRLPKPNRLELVALRLGSAKYRPDAQDALRLDLFPNRKTQYQLALVNRSGEPRQVRVELHALRLPRTARAAPGRIDEAVRALVVDRLTGILTNTQAVAASGPLKLPADESQPVPLTFAAPGGETKPQAKPEAKKDDAAAKPPPSAPPPPTAVAASAGLLCVVTEVDHPEQRWLKWIDLAVIRPSRYLDPKVAYDYGGKRIAVRLRAADLDEDGTPDLPPGEPVRVLWGDEDRQLPDSAAKKLSGELDSPAAVLDLYAAVPADNLKRVVRLAVDGYPRAIVYEVACDRDAPPEGVRSGSPVRSRPRVRINSLSAAGYPVLFHFPPYANIPPRPEKKDNAPAVEHHRVAAGQRVVVPAPARSLRVDFEVDAPVDSFLDPEDRVDVQLGERIAATLRADRTVSFQLERLGDRGLIELSSAVTDWSVEIPSENLENEQTRIDCTLHLHGPTDNEAKDRVVLVLDADQPTIDKLEVLRPDRNEAWPMPRGVTEVTKGAVIRVRATARDFSGPVAAQFMVSADDKPLLPKPATTTEARQVDGGFVFETAFATKELEPREYSLEARVTDGARHESEPVTRRFRVVAAEVKPTLGVIRGELRFGPNRVPVSGTMFTAAIKSPKIGAREVPLDAGGAFLITGLPADSYTITAEGSFQGRDAVGKLEGLTPSPPDNAPSITVVVDRKN